MEKNLSIQKKIIALVNQSGKPINFMTIVLRLKYTFIGLNGLSSMLMIILILTAFLGCSSSDDEIQNPPAPDVTIPPVEEEEEEEEEAPLEYAEIDFQNWKVTLPIDANNNGSPDEYKPDELVGFRYQTNSAIQPFMYDDTSDKSLVFYTYPAVSTTNSSYSRTELRELINPDSSRENWSLSEGGILKGKLKVASITKDSQSSNEYHRVIVMQIHGIISEEDMAIHGFSSNNGPPLLKMYWKDGNLWAHKKSLKDENTSGDDLLETSSATWTDVKYNFGYVGFEPFELEIIASEAKLEVILNNSNSHIFQDVSLEKWPYENYFKAGNYLISTDPEAESYIKYYELEVRH